MSNNTEPSTTLDEPHLATPELEASHHEKVTAAPTSPSAVGRVIA